MDGNPTAGPRKHDPQAPGAPGAAADAQPPSALWTVFERSGTGVALLDRELRVRGANRALADLLGCDPQALAGMPLHQFCAWPPAQRAEARASEVQLRRRSGADLTVAAQLSAASLPEDSGVCFVLTVDDLTQRRQFEQCRGELATARQYVEVARGFLDGAAEAVVVHGVDRVIRYWSASAQRMFGYTNEQARGRTYAELLGPSSALSDEEVERLFAQGSCHRELTCKHADGHLIRVDRHYRVIAHGDRATVFSMNIELGERHRAEKESMLVRNLLEQRLKVQSAQLRDSLEEMRDFSYSIAHDLRAPLTAIQGFSAQLQKRLAPHLDDTSRHYFARLRAGSDALDAMTQQLQALVRLSHTTLVPREVDLGAIAQRVMTQLCSGESHRQVTFTVQPMPPAIADLALAGTLLEHLLGNAWKFTATTPDACISFDTEAAPSGACVYRISDNGVGFDSNYAYKLFAPFQRLHSPHEFPGTGMGLALARKIVSRHGGRIWVESALGAGTRVYFTFHDPDVLKGSIRRMKIAEDVSGRWPPAG